MSKNTTVMVISKDGDRLMPTMRNGKVRHLLKSGKAKIVGRHPFTIQLLYETTNYTQPIELCVDTGAQHIGISLKSESREYVSAQYDLLVGEKERHDDARKLRGARRNRKTRHRK
jgi:N6-L-threonylcarbamoyladenine synthase